MKNTNTKKGFIDLVAIAALLGFFGASYSVSKTSDLNKEVKEMKMAKDLGKEHSTNTNK